MLIEIPVTITFDHQQPDRPGGRHSSRVFTVRYDTTDTYVPLSFIPHYPPRSNETWTTDKDGILFGFLSDSADRQIKRMAEQDPDTYAAKAA